MTLLQQKFLDRIYLLHSTLNDYLEQLLCLLYENMMNDAQTGNITGRNTIASALTNIVTGKEDANFSSPNGKYNFFTCSSNTLKCDEQT